MPAMAGILPETDCRTFFEDKKQGRRWNNGFRELGAPRPSEHLRMTYGGAKRTPQGGCTIWKSGQYALFE